MSTPQAKRRRLNEATKTLHKPFKSPFRTPLKPTNTPSDPSSSDSLDIDTATTTLPIISTPSQPPKPSLTTANPPPKPRIQTRKSKPSPSTTREIIQLRSDIQILTQAHALLTTSKDADLTALIETWRTASRAAAEEVFATARERVQRMGGVGAWREREKEQKEWRTKWDREEMEAERERRGEAVGGGNDDEEYADFGGEDGEKGEEEQDMGKRNGNNDDNDSFTMDMMLRTLNIDLKLIGYDEEAQRWDG